MLRVIQTRKYLKIKYSWNSIDSEKLRIIKAQLYNGCIGNKLSKIKKIEIIPLLQFDIYSGKIMY